MDEARIEALDAQPLHPYLAAIRAADTHDKAGRLHGPDPGPHRRRRSSAPASSTDQKAPTRYVVSTGQSGLGLPNRDYYLDAALGRQEGAVSGLCRPHAGDDRLGQPGRERRRHRGASRPGSPRPTGPRIQNRNRDETYNEYTIAQLAEEAPGFAWQDYYDAVGVGEVPRLIVRQDTAMPKIAAIYAETPIETIQAWQAFHTTDDAALAPVQALRRRPVGVPLARPVRASPSSAPATSAASSFAEGMLGEAVGRQYVAEYFPAESKAKMEELVANLRIALAAASSTYDLDERRDPGRGPGEAATSSPSRSAIPNKWRDYSDLEIRADDLFGNAERAGLFRWNYQLEPPERAGRQGRVGHDAPDGERLLQLDQ